MGITSERLKKLNLIDEVIDEPLGGAHRDVDAMASRLKHALLDALEKLDRIPIDKLLDQRYQRLMSYGVFKES
jgi:acetyl-CoA carboxylase carboxyl transferase subunit alpha